MKLLLLLTLLLSTSCSLVDSNEPQPRSQSNAVTAALLHQDKALCKAKGGAIKPACLSQRPMCIYTHADAGKVCSDSSECQGKCKLSALNIPAGTQTTGICSANNIPCGCFALVNKGIAKPAICLD